MPSSAPFRLRRKTFYLLLALGALILLGQWAWTWYQKKQNTPFPEVAFTTPTKKPLPLAEFNPNELDGKQWQQLGFTQRQVNTILKYKQVVGGRFTSKKQLQKCYAISEEKFQQLSPYILLPEHRVSYTPGPYSSPKKLQIKAAFDPDTYHKADWQKLGFTEKQAETLLKYRKLLGGSFISKEKFRACYVVSEEHYRILAPYLLLPEKTPDADATNKSKKKKTDAAVHSTPFDPNDLDEEGWQKLGFSEKQAKVIVNYREKTLKGRFRTREDLQKCFVISEEKFHELKPFIRLTESELAEKKLTAEPATPTDFSSIDLNRITYHQLREFGVDEKGAASLLGFRKKLGGFADKKQILETYNLDQAIALKLIETTTLNAEGIPRYKLRDAPEEWLQHHPYFRRYAERILFLRTGHASEEEILKKLKAKPEDEAKMKLYLK